MAWQAWLAPYTPFPHLTQIPVRDNGSVICRHAYSLQNTLYAAVELNHPVWMETEPTPFKFVLVIKDICYNLDMHKYEGQSSFYLV